MKETERRRRQFIRAHHPDRGGDLGTFIAGMRVFETQQALSEPPPRVRSEEHTSELQSP